MKSTSSQLKRRSKNILAGKYGICAGATFLTIGLPIIVMYAALFGVSLFAAGLQFEDNYETVLVGILIGFLILYILLIFILSLLGMGFNRMMLNICTERPFGIGDLGFAFRHHPFKFIGFLLLMQLIGIIPGIPYIIVSIMSIAVDYMPLISFLLLLTYIIWLVGIFLIALRLGMTGFILIDNPEVRITDAMRQSTAMMKGHKGRLFYLQLSFFGIFILGAFSFGIGILWILPYVCSTAMLFYLERKADMEPPRQFDGAAANPHISNLGNYL